MSLNFRFVYRVQIFYTRLAISTSKNGVLPLECSRKNIFPRLALIRDFSPRKNSLRTKVLLNLSPRSSRFIILKLARMSNKVVYWPVYYDLYHLQFMQFIPW